MLRRHDILSDPGMQEDLVTAVAVLGDARGRQAAMMSARSNSDPNAGRCAEEHIWLVASAPVQKRVAPSKETVKMVAEFSMEQIERYAVRTIQPDKQKRVQERLRADEFSWEWATGTVAGPAR